jgi:hypothetical protein
MFLGGFFLSMAAAVPLGIQLASRTSEAEKALAILNRDRAQASRTIDDPRVYRELVATLDALKERVEASRTFNDPRASGELVATLTLLRAEQAEIKTQMASIDHRFESLAALDSRLTTMTETLGALAQQVQFAQQPWTWDEAVAGVKHNPVFIPVKDRSLTPEQITAILAGYRTALRSRENAVGAAWGPWFRSRLANPYSKVLDRWSEPQREELINSGSTWANEAYRRDPSDENLELVKYFSVLKGLYHLADLPAEVFAPEPATRPR